MSDVLQLKMVDVPSFPVPPSFVSELVRGHHSALDPLQRRDLTVAALDTGFFYIKKSLYPASLDQSNLCTFL